MKNGRVDFLVNSAGVLWFGKDESVLDIDLDIWDKVFDINLKSQVHMCREFVPLMKKTSIENKTGRFEH